MAVRCVTCSQLKTEYNFRLAMLGGDGRVPILSATPGLDATTSGFLVSSDLC